MIIGIDFDNTIIDYHSLFNEAGKVLGVLPENIGFLKKNIREYLIGKGREKDWTTIQGLVYGRYIQSAKVMDGFLTFADLCYEKDWEIFIISHKTRESIAGEIFDLHASALLWLNNNQIYGTSIRRAVKGVFFEPTCTEKICRINQVGCDIIIDDLAKVLLHPDLSDEIIKILFDPDKKNLLNGNYLIASGWDQIFDIIVNQHG